MVKTRCKGECCRAHPLRGVCAHRRRCDYHRVQDRREAARAAQARDTQQTAARIRYLAKARALA